MYEAMVSEIFQGFLGSYVSGFNGCHGTGSRGNGPLETNDVEFEGPKASSAGINMIAILSREYTSFIASQFSRCFSIASKSCCEHGGRLLNDIPDVTLRQGLGFCV